MVDLTGIKEIFLYPEPISFRKGIMALAEIVQSNFANCNLNDNLYVFFSASKTQMKIIRFEDKAIWLYQKRLTDTKFKVPKIDNGITTLDTKQLKQIIVGIEAPVDALVLK